MVNFIQSIDAQRTKDTHNLANHVIGLTKEIKRIPGQKVDTEPEHNLLNTLRHQTRQRTAISQQRHNERRVANGQDPINFRSIRSNSNRDNDDDTNSTTLESFDNQIDTMIDSILGNEYGKYLK